MYWEHFHNQQLHDNSVIVNRGEATYEISNDWSSVSDYSLKIISPVWDYVGWRVYDSLTCSKIQAKVDVNSDAPARIILVCSIDGSEQSNYVNVPTGETTVTLNLTFDSNITSSRVDVRFVSYTADTVTGYMDNIKICKR